MADISNNYYFIGLATKDVTYTSNHVRSTSLRLLCEVWGIEPYEEAAKNASGRLHKVLKGL